MNLLLQPYARPSDQSQDNFLYTLARNFDLKSVVEKSRSVDRPNLEEFLESHPDGTAKIWALGNSANSKSVFSKVNAGDLVLFHGHKLIYGYGIISSKLYWPNNNFIWPSGEDWRYIYSLENFVEIPEGSQVERESLRQLFPKVGHLSAFFIDLTESGISQSDVMKHLQITPPHVEETKSSALTRGISKPPILGEKFKDRKSIWRAFGGQWQQGIVTFPGEDTVNAFSDEDGPYPDFKDPQTGVIEYRGQGLRGQQKLVLGNKLLEDARLQKKPVRYWHRPSGGRWVFESWVVVADRTQIVEDDTDSNSAQRILWFLVPIPSLDISQWPQEVVDAEILTLSPISSEAPKKKRDLLKNYASISAQLEIESTGKTISALPKTQYKRRKEARDLVLARANNKCENDKCTGMPPDVNRQGMAILQVDHIHPLGEGGLDIPSNMIALCPNCHSAKTFGLHSEKMIKRFKIIVERLEKLLR
jgi:5-methylcytosine-specific restriction enzyme A